MGNQTAVQALTDRMLSYDGCFDGYPSLECSDETLVLNAIAEHDGISDGVILMSYIASEECKTREQYDNCRKFILAYFESCWVANMSEGSNPVYAELQEEAEREFYAERGGVPNF